MLLVSCAIYASALVWRVVSSFKMADLNLLCGAWGCCVMKLRAICEDVGSDLGAIFSRLDAGEDPTLVSAVLVDFLRDLGAGADKWLVGGSVDELERNLERGGKKRLQILNRMRVSLKQLGVLCALGMCAGCGERCVADLDRQENVNGYVRSDMCDECLESGEDGVVVADFGW